MKKKLKWIIPLALALLLAVGAAVYARQYYPADAAAIAALATDSRVRVSQTEYGWFFDGPSEDSALIFYPGAKVEETAYAPLLRTLAEEGTDVCLVRMPWHLALFGVNRAGDIMAEYDYPRWYVGGHSLGGVCAGMYAAEHSEDLSGVLLLAAYPIRALDDRLDVLFVYGSEDGVLSRTQLDAYRHNAGESAAEVIIDGGNHAQFGSYGPQAGDGEASISAEEQVRETVDAFLVHMQAEVG